MKRWIAFLLTLVMILTLLPSAMAATPETPEADVWQEITLLEDQISAFRRVSSQETRQAAFCEIVGQLIEIVKASDSYVPGSLERHGDFFFWDTVDGQGMGYSPRLRAEIRETANPDADPEAYAGTETVSFSARGGSPGSLIVSAFQPYIGIDTSFTAQYENECNSIAQALGGTGITYKTTNATIDNIAQAIEDSAVVIFDSHGDTDYASGYDYTSRANTSYLCLQSGVGITAEDQVTVTGPYGSYKHAYYGGSYGSMQYYMVDGTAISNHMTGTSPNGLLWMAICLGMATDGMHAALRAKGVEVAYGYSQSVTFSGDYAWEAKFWQKMKAGDYVKDAIAYMKQQVGIKDPYTSSYPAYPIVVSSEDPYPGHGNVDKKQDVYSTWTLFPQFEINAVPNNPDWGTVSVNANVITATPAYGYYVDDYEVLEGEATVARNGNIFVVTAETDCTIQINFAARDPAVIQFSVPDGVSCDPINAYVGDEISLPAPTGEPAVESRVFRFLGWVTTPVAEDTLTLPEFLPAGAKLKVDETEKTFYALYSYFVAVDGLNDDEFVRVDEAPASWTGEYVITYDGQYALNATNSTIKTKISSSNAVVDLAEMGCVCEDDILYGVLDAFTYVISPAANGTYTVKMKSFNHYLAMDKAAASLTTQTSSNTDKTRWTISMDDTGIVIRNAYYTDYVLQYDSANNKFCAFNSKKEALTLFAKADGDTWYTTEPKEKPVCEEHVFGEWQITEEPTCTEPGSRYHFCTVCGTRETEELEALGHAWDEGVVTLEPTATEDGEKTYTCTRCSETKTEVIPKTGLVNPFEDVSEEDDFYDAVLWAVYNDPQITGGVDETHFAPHNTVTRAEAMTFLWAANGRPEPKGTATGFSDVKKKHWAYKAIMWAVEEGITGGTGDGKFSPSKTCNRSEILTFLYAAVGKPGYTIENPYKDVKKNAWYRDAAIWAYENGLELGEDGYFKASTPCTRASTVTYLYRFMNGENIK